MKALLLARNGLHIITRIVQKLSINYRRSHEKVKATENKKKESRVPPLRPQSEYKQIFNNAYAKHTSKPKLNSSNPRLYTYDIVSKENQPPINSNSLRVEKVPTTMKYKAKSASSPKYNSNLASTSPLAKELEAKYPNRCTTVKKSHKSLSSIPPPQHKNKSSDESTRKAHVKYLDELKSLINSYTKPVFHDDEKKLTFSLVDSDSDSFCMSTPTSPEPVYQANTLLTSPLQFSKLLGTKVPKLNPSKARSKLDFTSH